MLGIMFKKAAPTTYVMHYKNGAAVRQGAGLSFFYFAPTSTIVDIPLASRDIDFIFHEITSDFQEITLQGQLTFKIADPAKLAQILDFSTDTDGQWQSDDPDRLDQRLTGAVQVLARGVIQSMALKDALAASETIAAEVLPRMKAAATVTAMGVEILGLSISQVRPTPEMARALEAEAREALQRGADLAIYDRRNAAVEQERRIKESELNTEIAVEEKRRQIEETKMAAQIALEEQRAELTDSRCENERKDADSRAYALETSLRPLRETDWHTLMAAAAGGGDPRLAFAMAFQEMAENAGKIGQLTLTPDLLSQLITKPRK